MKKKPLPTHADEVDALRLQVAKLKMERLQEQCAAAVNEFARLLNDAEKKYDFSNAKQEVINLDTREIMRAPVEAVKPNGD
jgi:hypothetical protein